MSQLLRREAPFFIIGSPRSGTTMLRLMMTSHRQVVVPPECGFIIWLKNHYGSWSSTDSVSSEVVERFVQDLTGCKKFDTWELSRNSLADYILASVPRSYSELCASICEVYASKLNKQAERWGDKNNFHVNHIWDLDEIYPNAKFLHTVRDGRDVACSYREVMSLNTTSPYRPSLPTDVESIAKVWASDVAEVTTALEALPSARKMFVRYEDLVGNPELKLSEVCRWIGIDYMPSMLNFDRGVIDLNLEPKLTLDWKRKTLAAIDSGSIGRYKNELSNDERAAFTEVAGSVLREYGYQ